LIYVAFLAASHFRGKVEGLELDSRKYKKECAKRRDDKLIRSCVVTYRNVL